MLARNNPAIDYDRLLRDVLACVAAPLEEDVLDVERELIKNEKLEVFVHSFRKDIASAKKAHKVTSLLPLFFNPIFRDQAAINKAIFSALKNLTELLESQRAINAKLLSELRVQKQSDLLGPTENEN